MDITRIIAVVLSLLAPAGLAAAQLTNNGATIVIEQGATLVVEGEITNMSGSVVQIGDLFIQGPGVPDAMFDYGSGVMVGFGGITNSGTIEVQGDFTNEGDLGIFTPTDDFLFLRFENGLDAGIALGDIFPDGLTQAQVDASYTAHFSEFGSASPTPVSVPIVVPEPGGLGLLTLGGLAVLRRPRSQR